MNVSPNGCGTEPRGRGEAGSARLVEQARRHGVRDQVVLDAVGRVPRELFVPKGLTHSAFDDSPLPIGQGQTISQPAMVALMAEAARLGADDRVLEVGTGSGYGAAMLRALAGRVVTVERHESLARAARAALAAAGFGDVTVVVGDGTMGWPGEAPYDAIVVTAAGPSPPAPLVEQLAEGGRLVMPVGSRTHNQHLMRYTRISKSQPLAHAQERRLSVVDVTLAVERLLAVRFVALIGKHGFPQPR